MTCPHHNAIIQVIDKYPSSVSLRSSPIQSISVPSSPIQSISLRSCSCNISVFCCEQFIRYCKTHTNEFVKPQEILGVVDKTNGEIKWFKIRNVEKKELSF